MDLRTITIPFASVQGFGPNQLRVRVLYGQPVLQAAAAVSGYTARFTNGDHELKMVTVKVEAQVAGPVEEPDYGKVWVVDVFATLGLRDASGNWDDPYEGEITCCLMADLGRVLPDLGIRVSDVMLVEA